MNTPLLYKSADPDFFTSSSTKNECFSIAIIPDTHICDEKTEKLFCAQAKAIIDLKKTNNVLFALHLGDVVDHCNDETEWQRAVRGFQKLDEAGIPFGFTCGNHTISTWKMGLSFYLFPDCERSQNENYLRLLQNNPMLNAHRINAVTSVDGWSSYHLIEWKEKKYLILMLDYACCDKTIRWAKKVLKDHLDIPAILATHILISHASIDSPADFEYPEAKRIWDEVIKPSKNVFIAIGGHYFGEGKKVAKNDEGKDVLLIETNYQHLPNQGNGLFNLLTVNSETLTIDWSTVSPL